MMNCIWAILIIGGLAFSCFNNSLDSFSSSLLDSSTEAVMFIIKLAGVMAVWSGLMKIAEGSGLIRLISKKVRPLFRILFPEEKNDETISLMLMSFVANLFGAGNSATVFSLKTMERLDKENNCSRQASNTMCMFIALSMSMLQLVPITVIKIRRDLGSSDAGDIIIPSILTGIFSMIVSILICRIYERRQH